MLTNKTILLTGGNGFLGSYLLRRLLERGCRIVLLKRITSSLGRIESLIGKVRTYDIGAVELHKVFEQNAIDVILHCATNYGRNATPPPQIVEANLILPLNLLQIGSTFGVKAFVNSDTILDKGVNYYSLSKRQFKDWLQQYAASLACVNVALEHFYGPLDDRSKFITSMIGQLLDEVESIPMTKGEQRRDFIFVDDVVSAFEKIIEFTLGAGRGMHGFEVGAGSARSIRDVAELIKRLTRNQRTQLEFGALAYRPSEVMNSCVDTSPLKALGWEPKVTLEDGLRLTIEKERSLRS